jgi:hypothetical protein
MSERRVCPCRGSGPLQGVPVCEQELFEGYGVRYAAPVERVRQLTAADVLRDLARVEQRLGVVRAGR